MAESPVAIGVDVGGTKIEVIALSRGDQRELYRHRIASPQGSYTETIAAIQQVVTDAQMAVANSVSSDGAHNILLPSIGVGIPGSVSSLNQRVKNSNSTWINGQPLQQDLERALQQPIRIDNDANCFAVSEAVDGAGAGQRCVFGVIIGTGCGGGIAIEGRPLTGSNGLTGEWGHNPLPLPLVFTGELSDDAAKATVYFDQTSAPPTPSIYQEKLGVAYTTSVMARAEYPGPQCYCGQRGCIETWLSGTGFQNDYHRLTGRQLSAQQIVELMREGESQAMFVFDAYLERLAKSVAQIINSIDPDVVVLGGGMSNIAELYDEVPKRWQRYVFSDVCHTPLVPAVHGDSSGVRGAAWLW